ncbi:BnaC03g76800D [Brassica napus]|uniref:BnaC03g76800D protein n=1 Tax=Brassica napus TaxID=3708 RepID=A0A078J1E4_BRANA|nr:BnaC03g76800D [Brassica napus]
MAHLLTGSFDRLTFILLRLVLQVTIYYIWRERNDRKHNNSARPVNHVSKLIDKTSIVLRLLGAQAYVVGKIRSVQGSDLTKETTRVVIRLLTNSFYNSLILE